MTEEKNQPRVVVRMEYMEIGPNGVKRRVRELTEEELRNGGAMPTELIFDILKGAISKETEREYELGSAHYEYDITRCRNPATRGATLTNTIENYNKARDADIQLVSGSRHRILPVQQLVKDVLKRETTLPLKNWNLQMYSAPTREVVDNLLEALSQRDGKRIGLPIPNWHFWKAKDKNHTYQFEYLNASSEDQLVDNALAAMKEGKIGSLVLVNPSTPLMFTLSRRACKDLDRAALKEGVNIVVDDVLRGVQPIGNRDTIATHFTKPYVIEGFGKRFGDDPFQPCTYMISQDNLNISIPTMSEDYSSRMGQALLYALHFCEEDAINRLTERNRVFDKSLQEVCPTIGITRPSESHITTLLRLPNKTDAVNLATDLWDIDKVSICPVDMYFPKPSSTPAYAKNLARITVGRHGKKEIAEAARYIGQRVKGN